MLSVHFVPFCSFTAFSKTQTRWTGGMKLLIQLPFYHMWINCIRFYPFAHSVRFSLVKRLMHVWYFILAQSEWQCQEVTMAINCFTITVEQNICSPPRRTSIPRFIFITSIDSSKIISKCQAPLHWCRSPAPVKCFHFSWFSLHTLTCAVNAICVAHCNWFQFSVANLCQLSGGACKLN